ASRTFPPSRTSRLVGVRARRDPAGSLRRWAPKARRHDVASPRFLEILRCNGVDQGASPTGVVVPFHGENQVVLETEGVDLRPQPSTISLLEFEGLELNRQLLQGVQAALNEPGVDSQQKAAFMPSTGWRSPRFFRIRGTITTGFPGKVVHLAS